MWYMLCLAWHVADIGIKCLLNATTLHKSSWHFVQQNNSDGSDSMCLIAPDVKIFALSSDDHEMPILPTHSALVVAKAKPSTLRRLAQHLLHMAKYGNKPILPEPMNKKHCAAVAFEADMADGNKSEADEDMCRFEDTTEGESDSEWEMDEEDNAAYMASITNSIKKGQHTCTKALFTCPLHGIF